MKGAPVIVAFYGSKAGIGKSMAVLNAGYALAVGGRNVLIIDVDLKKPGLSRFLARNCEYEKAAEGDVLNLFFWVKERSQAARVSSVAGAVDEEAPNLDAFIVTPDARKLRRCLPDVGEAGRLDLVVADVRRNYDDRLQALNVAAASEAEQERAADLLRGYLKAQTFYEGPAYYGGISGTYDYILVDCPHGRPIARPYLQRLADRVVVCTDLNDTDASDLSRYLKSVDITKRRQTGDKPWDADDPAPSRDVPPRLGPKPTLIVAAPVPAGELKTKKEWLDRVERNLGPAGIRLTYHPWMAFSDAIFVRDCPDEYLAQDYRDLADSIMAMCDDHPTQLASQAIHAWFRQNDVVTALRAALRILTHSPSLGETLISFLRDNLVPDSEASFCVAEHMLRLLSHSADDRQQSLATWAACLETWSMHTADPTLAHQRRTAAREAFERLLQFPDLPNEKAVDIRFHLAMLQMAGSEAEAAMATFTTLLDLTVANPERYADALFNRGIVKDESGDREGAVNDFTQVADMEHAPPRRRAEAVFNRSLIKDDLGDTEGAAADWERLLRLPGAGPDLKAQAYFTRGLSRKSANDYHGAIEDWSAVIDMSDAPPELVAKTYLTRGALKLTLKNWEAATADFDAVIQLAEADPEVLANAVFNRALVALEADKDTAQAERDLREIADIEGAAPSLVADALLRLAVREQLRDDIDAAKADFTRVLAFAAEAPSQVAEAHFNLGVIAKDNDDYAAAIAHWTQVAESPSAPAHILAEAVVTRAVVCLETGDIDQAQADLDAVVEIQSAPVACKAEARLSRGMLAAENGDYEAAVADLSAVVDMDGAPPELVFRARFARASAERDTGNVTAAAEAFTALVELPEAPPNIVAKARLARATLRETQDDLEGAEADFRAVGDDETVPTRRRVTGLAGLARVLLARDKSRDAVDVARAALDLMPGLPPVRLELGIALLRLAQTDEGSTEIRAIVDAAEDPAVLDAIAKRLAPLTAATATAAAAKTLSEHIDGRRQALNPTA